MYCEINILLKLRINNVSPRILHSPAVFQGNIKKHHWQYSGMRVRGREHYDDT